MIHIPEQHHGRRYNHPCVHTIFFHPDYTVGLGISPNHALRLVGFTTGGESHPALKILIQLRKVYAGDTGLSIPFPKKAWKIQGLEGPRSTMAYEAPCGLH